MEIKDKFKDFPEVYYISLVNSVDRREVLKSQLTKYGITNINAILSSKETDNKNIITGPYIDKLTYNHINCLASHLRAIKEWYSNSDSEYAIFLEDDVSFETAEFWNFTWKDFMSKLPSDWECIQLVCIRDENIQIKLTKRAWDNWSISAYMLTRDYAKRLLNEYHKDEEFTLDLKNTVYWPVAENVLYFIGRTYTFPLFIENPNFKTVFENRPADNEHSIMHATSSNFVLDWWKNNPNHDLDELTNEEHYKYTLEFNR